MDLETFWFCLIVVVWAMYFLLEGFDFGVGMLLPFVPRSDEERSTTLRTIGPVWDGERGLARRGRRCHLRGVPGLVRDDVLGLLPGAPAHPLLPHRPRRVVRVALEEREPALARGLGVGEHDRELRRAARLGHRARRTSSAACRSTPTATTPAPSGISSPRTRVVAGVAVVALFAFHGATFLTLRTVGELHDRAERAARRLAIPAAVARGRLRRLDGRVAIDRNDKDLFPPALPAAARDRRARARRCLRPARTQRAGVRDDGARDRRRGRDALHEPLPAGDGLEPGLRQQPDRGAAPPRRTTRSR